MRMLFVTTYDMKDESLGGASWVDRLLVERLRAFGDVDVMTIASSNTEKDVPLEVSHNAFMAAQTVKQMLLKARPYQEAKFIWHGNWGSKRQEFATRASAVDLVISSQWPALLLAEHTGIRPDMHFAHNVDWVLSELYDPLPFRLLRNANRMKVREINLLSNAKTVLTLSKSDATKLRSSGIAADHLALNPDDRSGPAARTGNIGFIGKMSWPPNKMAIDNLLNRVLPSLNEERAQPVQLVVAGRGSEQYSEVPQVKALGVVENVRSFYRLVDLVVIPRIGESTGISVKMLEAVSFGKTVVAPKKLIEDAGLSERRAIAADSTDEIVKRTEEWLNAQPAEDDNAEQSDISMQSILKARIDELLTTAKKNEPSIGSLDQIWQDNQEKWIQSIDDLIDLALDGTRDARVQTVNLHHIYLALRRSDFRRSIAEADMLSADGWPIVAAVNRSAQRKVHRVTGSDFLVRILSDPRIENKKIAIVGASEQSHQSMAVRLNEVGATLVYSNFGRKEEWDIKNISASLRDSEPDITLVAVTPPFGDVVANGLRNSDTPGFIIGIGGAIEMLLGVRKRAPKIVQRVRLEWAYRMIQDPKHLLQRYLLQCTPAYIKLQVLARKTKDSRRSYHD